MALTGLEAFMKAAATIKLPIEIMKASTEDEIDAAFAEASEHRCSGIAVAQDPLFVSQVARIVAAADRHKTPVIYHQREFVEGGGLISYGTNFRDGYRQAGFYLGKILKGAKPADLPVLQPEKFELVVNQRTAKALSIEIPIDLAAAADEVIE